MTAYWSQSGSFLSFDRFQTLFMCWIIVKKYACIQYSDVTMGAFQITIVSIVYSTVCSGADQRKHQSSASLAFVRGIHRWPVNSPHKGPVTQKCFHLMTSSLSGVPDYFDRNKILSGYDLSHYQVPHCIRVFFYFVWFVFIHHNFQFYFKLCTYWNILLIIFCFIWSYWIIYFLTCLEVFWSVVS